MFSTLVSQKVGKVYPLAGSAITMKTVMSGCLIQQKNGFTLFLLCHIKRKTIYYISVQGDPATWEDHFGVKWCDLLDTDPTR